MLQIARSGIALTRDKMLRSSVRRGLQLRTRLIQTNARITIDIAHSRDETKLRLPSRIGCRSDRSRPSFRSMSEDFSYGWKACSHPFCSQNPLGTHGSGRSGKIKDEPYSRVRLRCRSSCLQGGASQSHLTPQAIRLNLRFKRVQFRSILRRSRSSSTTSI